MQRYKQIALIAVLLGISSVAHAAGTAPTTAVMFPPVASTCVAGDMNIISWDGQNQVQCVHVPKCSGMQMLTYNGSTFSCYPTGVSGALSGAPTAQIPATYNGPAIANLTPNPDPQTIPPLPAGVTPVSASASASADPSAANGLVITQGQ